MAPKEKFNIGATSALKDSTMAQWLASPISGDLKDVPGVGPAGIEKFKANGIQNTHQLIGQFLLFKGDDLNTQDHLDLFYKWLADIGISAHRAGVVWSVAEKVSTFLPGLVNKDDLDPPDN
jgi:hypothetical protein